MEGDRNQETTTVSDIIISELERWGIKFVFGVPGTSSLGLVDALRKNENVKYIVVRHEESAALAASAYNKLTGKIAALPFRALRISLPVPQHHQNGQQHQQSPLPSSAGWMI